MIKVKNIYSLLVLVLFVCACEVATDGEESNPSTDTIVFTNGMWKPDLSTADPGDAHAGWFHDGISVVDDYLVGDAPTAVRETIKANGMPGKVMTVYFGSERNAMSAPLSLNFDTPQPRFWLRFKYRIAEGQQISDLFEHKIIYAFTTGDAAVNVNWPSQGDGVNLQPRQLSETEKFFDRVVGWADLYGSTDASADGSYHSFEFFFDLDGVFRMWIDNILVAETTGLDLGSDPFESVYIPHNHNRFNLTLAAHDVDEIKMAIPTYKYFTRDESGNKMIGND